MKRWPDLIQDFSLWVLLLCALASCSTLPSKYVEQTESGITLTVLTTSPQQFRDKAVILVGVLVKERQEGERVGKNPSIQPWADDSRMPSGEFQTQ